MEGNGETVMTSSENKTASETSTAGPSFDNQQQDDAIFDDEELEDLKRALFRPKKVPDSNYICHICYKAGDHLIYDCPLVRFCFHISYYGIPFFKSVE